MKTAIYVEDGEMQLVLTPTTEFEKGVTNKINELNNKHIRITKGSFYECRGGYFRIGREGIEDESLMLRMVPDTEPDWKSALKTVVTEYNASKQIELSAEYFIEQVETRIIAAKGR